MAESNSDNGLDYNGRRVTLRIAQKGEKAFWGGPLDGSFDFTDDDDELAWWRKGSSLTHRYERDEVTKTMLYKGANNDREADGG